MSDWIDNLLATFGKIGRVPAAAIWAGLLAFWLGGILVLLSA